MYIYKVIADKKVLFATHKSYRQLNYRNTLRNFYKAYPMYNKIEIVYCGYVATNDIIYVTARK